MAIISDVIARALGNADRVIAEASDIIAAADTIMVVEEGGFGHQFHAPDMLRRFFTGGRKLILWLDWPLRQNPFAALLWPDVTVVLVPMAGENYEGVQEEWAVYPAVAQHMASHLVDRIAQRHGKLAFRYNAFLRLIEGTAPTLPGGPSINWYISYMRMVSWGGASRPALPGPVAEAIREALAPHPLYGAADRPLACVYLRLKGGDQSSAARIGSEPDDYLPAIELLRGSGHAVAVLGDRAPDTPLAQHVQHIAEFLVTSGRAAPLRRALARHDPLNDASSWRLIDHAPVLQMQRLLEMYFLANCRLFVGDAGGVAMFTPFHGVPTLIVNVLPYNFAANNSVLLFKVFERDGKPLSFLEVLNQHPQAYAIEGATVRNNTASEIRDAVATMLSTLDRHPFGVGSRQFSTLPLECHFRYCDGVVSPVQFHIERAAR